MNMTVTNIDHGSVGMGGNEFADETLALGSTATVAEGTILARSIAAATDGKLVPYDPDGSDGADTPVAVMPHELDGASGDNYVRPIISGTVKAERLVIDDGTDVGDTDLDALRQTSIVPVSVEQLAQQDNQ